MSRVDVQDALQALSEAHGPAALASAFQALKSRVKAIRRPDTQTQTLGRIVMEAITMRDTLKAGGLSGPELDKGLEAVLRATWPKPKDRTEPWHDACANCRDYGLEMLWCPGDATCGPNPVTKRPRKAHGPHEYGKPCWCPAGRQHQDKRPPTPDDATTLAAKPRKMSRWGR